MPIQQKRYAVERLKKRIEALLKLDVSPAAIHEWKALEVAIEDALTRTYRKGTPEYERYGQAAKLWEDYGFMRDSNKTRAVALLKQAVQSLSEDIEEEQIAAEPHNTLAAGGKRNFHQ